MVLYALVNANVNVNASLGVGAVCCLLMIDDWLLLLTVALSPVIEIEAKSVWCHFSSFGANFNPEKACFCRHMSLLFLDCVLYSILL